MPEECAGRDDGAGILAVWRTTGEKDELCDGDDDGKGAPPLTARAGGEARALADAEEVAVAAAGEVDGDVDAGGDRSIVRTTPFADRGTGLRTKVEELTPTGTLSDDAATAAAAFAAASNASAAAAAAGRDEAVAPCGNGNPKPPGTATVNPAARLRSKESQCVRVNVVQWADAWVLLFAKHKNVIGGGVDIDICSVHSSRALVDAAQFRSVEWRPVVSVEMVSGPCGDDGRKGCGVPVAPSPSNRAAASEEFRLPSAERRAAAIGGQRDDATECNTHPSL